MKKLLSLFLVLGISVPSFGWGLLSSFVHSSGVKNPYRATMLYHILNGKRQFRVCVDLDDASKEEENAPEVAAFLVSAMQKGINIWFSSTRDLLEKSGRKDEFADILAVLPQSITLQWVNPQMQDCSSLQYDLGISGEDTNVLFGKMRKDAGRLYTNYEKSGWGVMLAAGKDLAAEMKSNVSRTYRNNTEIIALHEAGHLWGVADQYEKNGVDARFSLASMQDITNIRSIMQKLGDNQFSCDDSEGLIHAIDYILRKEDQNPSARVRNGWADLCGRGYVYIDGLPVRNKDKALALTQRQSFMQWAKAGYPADKKPAFIASAQGKEQDKERVYEQYIQMYSAASNMKRDLESRRDSISYSLNYAQNNPSYLTKAEKAKYEKELKEINAQLDDMEGYYNNLDSYFAYINKTRKLTDPGVRSSLEAAYAYFGEKLSPEQKDTQTSPAAFVWPEQETKKSFTDIAASANKGSAPVIDTSKPVVPATMKKAQNQPLRLLPNGLRKGTVSLAASVPQRGTPALEVPYRPVQAPVPVSAPAAPTLAQSKPAQTAAQAVPSVYKTPQVPQWNAPLPAQKPALASANALSAQPAKAAQPKVCDVCGKPVEGSSYYTDSVGRHVHKGGECAYKYFARFHKTDDKSLAGYDDFYFFHKPQAVTMAKADMRHLGITTAGIRAYLSQKAAQDKARQATSQIAQVMRRTTQEVLDKQCDSYHVVTQADLDKYIKKYSQILNEARRKRKDGKKLSKKEEKTLNDYYALFEDFKTTQFCQSIEKKK